MNVGSYPVEFIRAFLKIAQEDTSPRMGFRYGVGSKTTNRFVPRGAQAYTRPNPPGEAARPETVLSQQSVPPPPVQ